MFKLLITYIFILNLNLFGGILGPLENIIPNEKYNKDTQEKYHYTFDKDKNRYRAIEDCQYYNKNSKRDDFCEDIIRQSRYNQTIIIYNNEPIERQQPTYNKRYDY